MRKEQIPRPTSLGLSLTNVCTSHGWKGQKRHESWRLLEQVEVFAANLLEPRVSQQGVLLWFYPQTCFWPRFPVVSFCKSHRRWWYSNWRFFQLSGAVHLLLDLVALKDTDRKSRTFRFCIFACLPDSAEAALTVAPKERVAKKCWWRLQNCWTSDYKWS